MQSRTRTDCPIGSDISSHSWAAGLLRDIASRAARSPRRPLRPARRHPERISPQVASAWYEIAPVGPVFTEMRTQYDGPVVIAQDLAVFDITKEAVVARQGTIDPVAWPVVGPTTVQGPPACAPHTPPAWWADALLTD